MAHAGAASMVDVVFAVSGGPVPADYAVPLHAGLRAFLPWLDDEADAAVHPLRRVTHVDDGLQLGAHSRLALRVPEARADACSMLEGATLDVGNGISVGKAQRRPLLAFPTLYSPLVVTGDHAEGEFLAAVQRIVVGRWDSRCEVIVGRAGACAHESGPLEGFSLMLHGVAPALSLRAQAEGIGGYRKFGCGVFVPHRSAAAVVA